MTLIRNNILCLLYDNGMLRFKEIQKRVNTTVSTPLKRLMNEKLIEKIKGEKYHETYYVITDNGKDNVTKTTRLRILEELSKKNMQTQTELKRKINNTVSPVLGRMRRDKQVERLYNQDNGNDIRYSITKFGLENLKEYKVD